MKAARVDRGLPRVLFVMPGLGVGGAERHTLSLRRGMQARDYDSHLLVYGRRCSDVIEADPGAAGAIRIGARGLSSLSGWIGTGRAIRRLRPDVIIAVNQMPLNLTTVLRAVGLTRAGLACIFHTTILRPGDEREQAMFARAAPWADSLVYVSHRQAEYWQARGLRSRRDVVIQNGIDLAHFTPDPAERARMRGDLGIGPGEVLVGISAALWEAKNHAQLVEAVARLRAAGRPVRLLVIGEGPTREALERQVAALGIADRVIFAGVQADVRPWLRACDVGVICSVAVETFSLAAIEFLACGVPMVMSDIGGASEIVQDGRNGRLVPAGDVEALTAALDRLLDPAARSRLAAEAQSSVAHLSLPSMIERYTDLIASLVPRT